MKLPHLLGLSFKIYVVTYSVTGLSFSFCDIITSHIFIWNCLLCWVGVHIYICMCLVQKSISPRQMNPALSQFFYSQLSSEYCMVYVYFQVVFVSIKKYMETSVEI